MAFFVDGITERMWLAAIPGTLAAVISLIGVLVTKLHAKQNAASIQEIHIQIDGRMDQLLALSKQSAHAAGMLDEKQEQKDRVEAGIKNAGSALQTAASLLAPNRR